jgi:hypothetical protein
MNLLDKIRIFDSRLAARVQNTLFRLFHPKQAAELDEKVKKLEAMKAAGVARDRLREDHYKQVNVDILSRHAQWLTSSEALKSHYLRQYIGELVLGYLKFKEDYPWTRTEEYFANYSWRTPKQQPITNIDE